MKIIICIEDPGAKNFLEPIINKLSLNNKIYLFIEKSIGLTILNKSITIYDIKKKINFKKFILFHKISICLTGTSENIFSLVFLLHAACKELNIPSVGAIDGPGSPSFRYRGDSNDPFTHAPNYILVSDDFTKNLYVNEGYKKTNIIVVGHPSYNVIKQKKLKFDKKGCYYFRKKYFPYFDESKPILIFLSELSSGLNKSDFIKSSNYTLEGRGKSQDRTRIVLEEVIEVVKKFKNKPYLVLRLHPKENESFYSSYKNDVDLMIKDRFPHETVYAANAVIGMTTFLIMEAALLGKPTLSIVPRKLEKSWLISAEIGLTPCIYEKKNLETHINSLIFNPSDICPSIDKYDFISDTVDKVETFLKSLL